MRRDTSETRHPFEMETSRLIIRMCEKEAVRNLIAFWMLGCINNIGYVIMIAGAEEISSGAVGLVYFFQIFPSLAVKLTGPYWFHYISYRTRVYICAFFMALSFIVVASSRGSLTFELIGVFASGIGSGLGEASFLALTAFYNSRKTLSCWSSGTGFAGVGGYLWVSFFHYLLDFSFQLTLIFALFFPICLLLTFHFVLEEPNLQQYEKIGLEKKPTTDKLSCIKRLRVTMTLWPYIVPLIVVYFAEYTMQAGTWAAIGFPITDKAARSEFYEYANSFYQLGVFLSRSSGAVFQASHRVLFLMPVLQVAFLLFFTLVSVYHFWYNWWLLIPCFLAGLLGGAVYVNAFTLLARDVDPDLKEFSLSAASVGDSVGILFADIAGVILQGCLYSYNRIPGAKVQIEC